MTAVNVEPGRCGENWDSCPHLTTGETFDFACAGCGDCCRKRRDLVLSGYDLYRIARRLRLSPRIVASAFCKSYVADTTCLPALRLTPDPKTGDCRFFEGSACAIHAARPLACALYPLGQSIDTVTAKMEYYVQTPLCGARAGKRTLQDYLNDAAIPGSVRVSTRAGPSSARSCPRNCRPRVGRTTRTSLPPPSARSAPSTTTIPSATSSTHSFAKT